VLSRRSGVFSVLVATALAACGGAAIDAAQSGDLARLKGLIAERHGRGALGDGEAARLARAVAERELATAKREEDALARLRETRACAGDLGDALADRMKTKDGAGAEAALALLEDKRLSQSDARELTADPDDRWRAVGARALVRDDDRKARQAGIVDPSPRVRRSAVRASAEARDLADVDLLLETARVDPEPLLRNEAVRAASAILRANANGDAAGPRARTLAMQLRDLWTAGDDALREEIAVAWALRPVFASGGRDALRTTIAAGRGPGAIAGAGVVLQIRPADEELVSASRALLARTIDEGPHRDRLHAIFASPLEGTMLEALRKAVKPEEVDLDVRVAALGRLLASRPDHDKALAALEAIAGQGVKGGPPLQDPRLRPHVERARLALAAAGDARVQAWIEEDLGASEPARKLGAASALAALGRAARAAPLLADPDPSVRTRAACTILVATRR
jgi:hypothetical protein